MTIHGLRHILTPILVDQRFLRYCDRVKSNIINLDPW